MSHTNQQDRVILHCDCNGFFASVETLSHPELKHVPMAVTGDPDNRHGIILAKNELAKAYGIKTAETIWQAKKKCRDLVCVPAHHDEYHRISEMVNRIYLDYTDLVDPFGIDESFLDVTGSLRFFGMSPKELADTIRNRVHKEIGITISVGVSFCRAFAKLGSDYKKPDATTVIDRSNYKEIAWPLPVSDLLYAGKKTTEALRRIGIHTIGELAACEKETIERLLGESGIGLWRYARGLDDAPVRSFYDREEVKSVGNGMTFRRDISGKSEIMSGVSALADSVAARLRTEGKKCTVVQVQIKDPSFRTLQKQRTLRRATWLKQELSETAVALIREAYGFTRPIRALTITAASLIPHDEAYEQLDMFGEAKENEKQENLEDALADIRKKFGTGSIHLGAYENKDIGVSLYKSEKPKKKFTESKFSDFDEDL